ncbi:Virus attachment protein p12 family protein [Porphyromonadaceae bacterium NLAE-zl-C104]|uniref:FeoB-associated Cys-rich membrane protein n=1 Tax=Proteiniphilum saccharofermentans TaxID=1642647 RepID=UPI0008E351E4|nr:FeoB-associated Cys-rich membrane protein [Proteiniphilum saccharofermentans]SFS63959.1 Virus attachment protein p12 family protein [Porphyromonadaceae bacterium NLAE-zl-C104]
MDTQLFIVIIIGIIVGIILIRAIYRFFFTERDHSSCGGCKGCDIQKEQARHLNR